MLVPVRAIAAPGAGTAIDNRASATFTDTASGQGAALDSNRVTVVVAQVAAFSLSAAQNKVAAAGVSISFQHTITNLGNGPDSFALSLQDNYAGTFAFGSVQLYADANSDGVADSAIPISTTPVIGAGQSFNLIAIAQVPGGASLAQEDRFTVTAGSNFGGVPSQSNLDIVNITNNAVMVVTKSFSAASGPSPYSGLIVTLNYSNIGSSPASNVTITDLIGAVNLAPAYNSTGLSYVPASGRWQAQPLTDAVGGDPVGINFQASPVAGVTIVAAILTSVAPNTSGSISFAVDIKAGLPLGSTTTSNMAAIQYFDGAATQSVASNNTATYNVASGGPDLVLSKIHSGSFTAGALGTFTLQVRNLGSSTTSAPITVVDTMPNGLVIDTASLPSGGAAGWSCSAVAQTVTCASSILLAAGQPHPNSILLSVRPIAVNGNTTLVNTATVSGGGEAAGNAGNNSASDSVVVVSGASVSGRAWYDINHNRRFDGNEPIAPGIVVELRDSNNILLAQTQTNSSGAYSFANLQPGPGYRIAFRAPGGSSALLGSPVNGEQGVTQSGSDAVIANGIIDRLTLSPGANIIEQSLPLDPSGVVYDAATRQAIAGAIVSLTGPAGFDPNLHLAGGQANATQTTGPLGFYQFLLLPSAPIGVYSLAVTAPSGYRAGVAASLPKAASIGCGVAACLDPTGLAAAGGTYSVQPANIATAPPLGQDTTYYLNFNLDVSVDPNVVNNHIPLDAASVPLPGLLASKVAGRTVIEIGEMVLYTIRVRNGSGSTFPDVQINDVMPFGFKLVPGTVKLGVVPLADPVLGLGGSMSFRGLGNLPADGLLTLTYLARAGAGAQLGDAVNKAQAVSGNSVSNIAAARVTINGGMFGNRGIVMGKIYVDCNHNHEQDDEELGIPGVRIFLEDGSFVITDSEGKYSFVGVTARTHVLKVDRTTVPRGTRLASISNRHGLDGGSRFVDLKNGELHRADFAEFSCSSTVLDDVKARRSKGEVFSLEAERALTTRLDPEGKAVAPADARALPASGIVGVTPGVQTGVPVAPIGPSLVSPSVAVPGLNLTQAAAAQASALPSANLSGFGQSGTATSGPLGNQGTFGNQGGESGARFGGGAASPISPVLRGPESTLPVTGAAIVEKLLADADNKLGFLDLKDGDTLPIQQTHVRVKGPMTAVLKLSVNGNPIGADRIGTKSEVNDKQLQYLEFIGVPLKAGRNELVLSLNDGFGNERGREIINLIAPDQLGQIQLQLPSRGGIADGRSAVRIDVRLTDHRGVPVTVRTPLTLEASFGRWNVKDQDPNEPGVQTFIVGGTAQFELLAPLEPVDSLIRVSSGILKAEAKLPFLPELRPLIATGVIEGIINARTFNMGNIQQVRARDGFEQQLSHFARDWGDGRTTGAARSAFFLKGKVKGDYLLTVAYDSDKEVRERLFRDIQPNEFYPVYGDSAIRGFDAQSTSHLYVRIDRNRSYLLWGDFTTATLNPTQRLSQYQRSLTGLKHHYETESLRIDSFASRDTTRQVIREVPANGTSGPFEFSLGDALINSEKVELLTRDRNQPAVILKAQQLVRFTDYEFDAFTSRLLMRAPVPSVDPFLNPISIRITAETDQGGAPFWVYGSNAQVRLSDSLWVGGTYVRNNNPIPESFSRLIGANARYEFTAKSALTVELANTLKADDTKGKAERVEWVHESASVRARVFAGRAGADFDNPASTLNKGREEAGGRVDYLVRPGTIVATEALHSKDTVTGAARNGVLLSVEQAIDDRSKVEVGVRHVTEHVVTTLPDAPGDTTITSARVKASTRLPQVVGSSVYGEYEQDIKDSSKKLAAVGGEYQFATRGKLYARHEFISSLQGAFALNGTARQNTTVFGIATDYMTDGTLFSEYRGRDSFGQRTTEAAIGLKNFFTLTEGLRLNTAVERVQTLSGTSTQESFAVALGLDYTASPLWKGSTRLEFRDSASTQSWLQTAGAAMKLDRDWTMLGKHILNTIHTKEQAGTPASDRLLQRTQLGIAYRETDRNRVNALAMVEKKIEKDDAVTATTNNRDVSIVSAHVNYQPARSWVMNARHASKWVTESIGDLRGASRAQLYSGRLTWDFTERWDASVMASTLNDRATGTRQRGLGLELGYLVQANLWISAGFNVFGYRDRDLTPGEPTDRGFFLRLRFKFDEDLFGGPSTNR